MIRRSININQIFFVKVYPDLDIKDATLIDFVWSYSKTKSARNHRVIHEGDDYYWFKYSFVIENLPLLQINNELVIKRRFQKLVQSGLLKKHPNCREMSKSYFAPTEKMEEIYFAPNEGMALKSTKGMVLKSTKGMVLKSTKGMVLKSTNRRVIKEGNNKEGNNVEQNSTPTPKDEDIDKLRKGLNAKNAKHEKAVIEIVDYFREKSGKEKTAYSTKGALKLMLYWLNRGKTVGDFKKVIDYKIAEFVGTENERYIKLDTFCRENKFEDTLQEAESSLSSALRPEDEANGLPEDIKQIYLQYWLIFKKKYPNAALKVKFFSAEEFKKWMSGEWCPGYRVCGNLKKKRSIRALSALDGNPTLLSKTSNIYNYLITYHKKVEGIKTD